MNILFFTDSNLSPYMGGVERLTLNLAKELQARGYCCYLAYFSEIDKEPADNFTISWRCRLQELETFITENSIDTCIVNISRKENISALSKPLYEIGKKRGVRIVSAYYIYPGFELNTISCGLTWYRITHGQCDKETIAKRIMSILIRMGLRDVLAKKIGNKLRYYLWADELVVQSESYIGRFRKLTGAPDDFPISAIGNPLSYKENIALPDIAKKKKIVLSVARFDDQFKRQSLALKIWREIEKEGRHDDWRFVIIGYGPDEEYIKSHAKGLRNVSILPAQNPAEYLKSASIYMLTSAYEGLPMIVLDAQQYGLPTIGFDSFDAIHDIIEDGENGVIVRNNDIKQFARKVMWLMDNGEERQKMSKRCTESCMRFTTEKITDKWETVINR